MTPTRTPALRLRGVIPNRVPYTARHDHPFGISILVPLQHCLHAFQESFSTFVALYIAIYCQRGHDAHPPGGPQFRQTKPNSKIWYVLKEYYTWKIAYRINLLPFTELDHQTSPAQIHTPRTPPSHICPRRSESLTFGLSHWFFKSSPSHENYPRDLRCLQRLTSSSPPKCY